MSIWTKRFNIDQVVKGTVGQKIAIGIGCGIWIVGIAFLIHPVLGLIVLVTWPLAVILHKDRGAKLKDLRGTFPNSQK